MNNHRRRRRSFGRAGAWWDPEELQTRSSEAGKEHVLRTCRDRLYKDEEIDGPYPPSEIRYGDPCYMPLLRAGLPVRGPKVRPGQLVYDSFIGANVPALHVRWERPIPGWSGFWRVNTPGHSGEDINYSPASAYERTNVYKEVQPGVWQKVGVCEPVTKRTRRRH